MTSPTPTFSPQDYSDFTGGYLDAALWSTNDEDDPEADGLDSRYDGRDFSPEAAQHLVLDCIQFMTLNAELLRQAMECDGYDAARAGHDFWLTRQGHGVGYWDRPELGETLGQQLTQACERYGMHHDGPYADEEGRVWYGSPKMLPSSNEENKSRRRLR